MVALHGVSLTLPPGWSQGTPTLCGPVLEHTVTIYSGRPQAAACPSNIGQQKDVEAISLIEVFGAWGSLGWIGSRTTFDGQPAWITQQGPDGADVTPCPTDAAATVPCPPTSSGARELRTTTLALPWLNATVLVRGATSARTQELLQLVTVHAVPAVAVPDSASSMSVAWAADYVAVQTTTSQDDIDQTLTALRGLPPMPVADACRTPAMFGPIVGGKVVTFTQGAGSTTFLVADAPCSQVTAGTGAAIRASPALYEAIARVPLPAMR